MKKYSVQRSHEIVDPAKDSDGRDCGQANLTPSCKEAPMSSAEATRLRTLEKTIQRGLQSFIEVGRALAEIRDSKLYRKTHKTFEAYCRDKWRISRQNASQNILAATTAVNLSTRVDKSDPSLPLPSSEYQVRPLGSLADDADAQVACWENACKIAGGSPSATLVRRAVKAYLTCRTSGVMKDAPEETPEYHDTLEKFLRFMAELPSVRRVAAWKWIHHMTAQRYPADLVGNMKDPEPEKGMVTLPVEKIPFPSAA